MLLISEKLELELKAKLFRGFADPSRLSILETLRVQPLNVGEIAQATGLNQPNISNHLGCLRDCGLVMSEQRGRYTYYRLADDRIDSLLSLAEELLSDVAKGVYQCTRYESQTAL
jgi:ArsR family transcriptional regulator, cadmium/lead-responsive transcriptional repressor